MLGYVFVLIVIFFWFFCLCNLFVGKVGFFLIVFIFNVFGFVFGWCFCKKFLIFRFKLFLRFVVLGFCWLLVVVWFIWNGVSFFFGLWFIFIWVFIGIFCDWCFIFLLIEEVWEYLREIFLLLICLFFLIFVFLDKFLLLVWVLKGFVIVVFFVVLLLLSWLDCMIILVLLSFLFRILEVFLVNIKVCGGVRWFFGIILDLRSFWFWFVDMFCGDYLFVFFLFLCIFFEDLFCWKCFFVVNVLREVVIFGKLLCDLFLVCNEWFICVISWFVFFLNGVMIFVEVEFCLFKGIFKSFLGDDICWLEIEDGLLLNWFCFVIKLFFWGDWCFFMFVLILLWGFWFDFLMKKVWGCFVIFLDVFLFFLEIC